MHPYGDGVWDDENRWNLSRLHDAIEGVSWVVAHGYGATVTITVSRELARQEFKHTFAGFHTEVTEAGDLIASAGPHDVLDNFRAKASDFPVERTPDGGLVVRVAVNDLVRHLLTQIGAGIPPAPGLAVKEFIASGRGAGSTGNLVRFTLVGE